MHIVYSVFVPLDGRLRGIFSKFLYRRNTVRINTIVTDDDDDDNCTHYNNNNYSSMTFNGGRAHFYKLHSYGRTHE